MTAPTRGRIVRGAASVASGATTLPRLDMGRAGRRIAKEELEARVQAERVVADAEARAATIARDAAERAATEARAAEQAKLAAAWLALRAAEEQRAERDLERAVELAKILAERLLGSALDADPALVATLAKGALREARGARRARIEAHPLDADVLKAHLGALGLAPDAVEIVRSDDLSRGSLVLHTDLGILDAKLAPQLDRLAAALRDALRPA